jgi:hypothetical protein
MNSPKAAPAVPAAAATENPPFQKNGAGKFPAPFLFSPIGFDDLPHLFPPHGLSLPTSFCGHIKFATIILSLKKKGGQPVK